MTVVTNWHLITSEYPPRVGGVSDYSQLVAEGLVKAGDDVHVWCPPLPHVAVSNGVHIHPELGRMTGKDLRSVGRLLDRFASPRRLLVQWVPHGFGCRSMNLAFCIWIRRRARRGDQIDVMVHEPYLAFWDGSLRQTAAAAVHRLMTIVLASAASRIWVAIPMWERRWRPYALGRGVAFEWLPIPSTLSVPTADGVRAVREQYARAGTQIVGHLGTYGPAVVELLREALPALLSASPSTVALLLGQGGEALRARLAADHPRLAARVLATGSLPHKDLARYVACCDLLLQPYPDGVSTRRTSAMAGLALGVPIVTTTGHLTEPLWAETGAVVLVDVKNPETMAQEASRLLADVSARRQLSARGREMYERQFHLRHTIAALRRAALEPAACVSQF